MDIKVLGTGCPKCKRLESAARDAVARLGIAATVTKIEDIDQILAYDVMMTPGLMINDKVVSVGRVPRTAEIQAWIAEAAGR